MDGGRGLDAAGRDNGDGVLATTVEGALTDGAPSGEARRGSLSSRAPMHTGGIPYQPALDGIRALAVLAVIAYHDNYRWARGGFLGVDAFFVLSGYLITTLLIQEFRRNGVIRLRAFWGRRARRLMPAVLLVLLFVALYTRHYVLSWDRPGIRNDGLASLFYVANWRFILDRQSYFELFAAASPLRHMWSLAIEEQFYLAWPLVVVACLKLGRGSLRLLGAVCSVGIVASILVMSATFVTGDPSRAYYGTDARAHSLLVGALLAVLLAVCTPRAVTRRVVNAFGLLAMTGIVVAWTQVSGTSARYYRGGSAVYAIAVALVIAGALQVGLLRSALSLRPLTWIGRISYGLYLWHWPIDVWIVRSRVHVDETTLNALRLLLTFVAATVSFYVVERPIRRHGMAFRPLKWVAAPVVALVVAATVVSAAGATPPPSYLWGFGDPLVCGPPRPSESREALDAARRNRPPPLPRSASRQRILLIGDSTACSLWPGLQAAGSVSGIFVDQGSVFGCGVASGQITTTRNESITPHSERCPQYVEQTVRRALARARPTVVVWMSIWEKSDLVVNGETVIAGTRRGEQEIRSLMDAALARLTAGGARVVMITEAAPAPNPAQGTQQSSVAADDAGYVRLNALLRRFARRHPDQVAVADLAGKLCPSGPPCQELIEGMHPRPDGRHFTPSAAVWAAQWLLPQLMYPPQG
jgi:peptidoglycan/LPS O-acetylase OafA/YrhL